MTPAKKVSADNAKPYTLEIAVADLPKMPNQLLGAHWRVRSGHAKKWLRAVERAIDLNGAVPASPLRQAELWCTRLSSGVCDRDGLSGSFKAPIDALVKLGVLEDDGPEHVIVHYAHEKASPGKGSVRIRVVDLSHLENKKETEERA